MVQGRFKKKYEHLKKNSGRDKSKKLSDKMLILKFYENKNYVAKKGDDP